MKRPSPRQLEALALVAAGKFYPDFVKEDDGWHARWRAVGAPDNPWVDDYVRTPSITALSEDAEDQRHETLHDAWAMALRSRTGLVRWDEAECAAFAEDLRGWHDGAADETSVRKALAFTLSAKGEAEGSPFTLSCAVPKGRAALKALGQATYVWGALRGLRLPPQPKHPNPQPKHPNTQTPKHPSCLSVSLDKREAEDYLRRGARDLRDAGYTVDGVDFAVAVTAEAEVDGPAERPSVKIAVKVDGEVVTAEEIRFLLEQGSTLVFFRNRWIEVDRAILKEALRALERQNPSAANPLAFALGIGAVGRLAFDEAKTHGWIRGLVNSLRQSASAAASGEKDLLSVPGLAGNLRAYQARGVRWMRFLTDNGFGALLADDMGLGKTIQSIAWILSHFPQTPKNPDPNTQTPKHPNTFLIIAPLTLVGNWKHEFAKFAPQLRVYVHQGEMRHLGSGFKRAAAEADVVITSTSLLVKDHRELAEVEWEGVVLDEAQAIKNPDAQCSRAIRALGVRRRLALTGTPIENSVMDVWSLEEFLNPGFLGDRKSFADRFVKPLAADGHAAAGKRLRRALEPFVLRRLKSDPLVAGELGEKREVREYCALAASERLDYENALADYRASERKQGDVFALITRLKLICDGEGKLARLEELLRTIFEGGESALVFTQYAKVGAWLRERLAKTFGTAFPFLHGALSAAAREREIRAFRESAAPTAFLLSLKAGGFGLNLTKATHVIHFDRWWNPAVESQATDRAHRIGQEKTVFVHAFVTEGTLEERVEEILDRKESLAGLLKDGEAFWEMVKIDV